nr:MAG TPA: hypothetical protein [Crassvirales sp.]
MVSKKSYNLSIPSKPPTVGGSEGICNLLILNNITHTYTKVGLINLVIYQFIILVINQYKV